MFTRAFPAFTVPPEPQASAPVHDRVNDRGNEHDGRDDEVFPHHPDSIPPGITDAGSYALRFAWTRADLHEVQALRYRVFNAELGSRASAAVDSAREADERDPWFHHLMIVHQASGVVVGTYRLQTAVMAATRFGFYSATLFELGAIPDPVLGQAVEIGRACVDRAHRSGRVVHLLWRGLARYLKWNEKRFLFGCCSIAGIDPQTAQASWRTMHARQALHDHLLVRPRPHTRALADDGRVRPSIDATGATTPLPPLFDAYLALGARVCGAPAFDRDFGTTDYLVMLDVQHLAPHARRSFFG